MLGVIGKKPIHLMKTEDRERASKFTDLWVDIGATSRAEAEARVSVGDPGVIDSRTLDFPNDRIVSRSIDDRIGAFVVLEALRRYAEKPGAARVVAAATTQEEIAWHGGGAAICAHCINPKMAIVVDVTFATDHPNIEKKEIGEHKIGGGPVLTRGALISPVVLRPAARDGEEARDRARGARGGARHVDERRRDPHRARGRGDGAGLDPEPVHALAERNGVARGRRQRRDAHRRVLPGDHDGDGPDGSLDRSALCAPGRFF